MSRRVRNPPDPVAAVVFDCDGLLVDTEPSWTRAETAIFAEHGFAFGPEQKALVIGRTVEAAADNMAGYFGRPAEGAALAEELLERVRGELDGGAEPMPGAVQLVREIAARVPVAVASNSPHALLEVAIGSAGLAELLPVALAADDVAAAKPAPDIYLAACRLLGADPVCSVAFEDSATGARSARAAGLYLITVASLPGQELDEDWRLDSLAESELLAWARSLTPMWTGSRG